ncbi:Vacuolar protein sorting-associated protein 70 [Marasmius tenuissimus]|uniref:Vacuolar protein sorting-associated protein 70 n=1 Tax=Marasmius tenuissimus TaxID=585030 RepID=A0ABR3A3T1_9AGAR
MSFNGSSSAQTPFVNELDRLRAENAALRKHQKRLQDDLSLWNKTAMTWQRENHMLFNNHNRMQKERDDFRNALLKLPSQEHDRLRNLHERENLVSKLEEANKKLYQDNIKLVGDMMTLQANLELQPSAQTALRLSDFEKANKALYEDNTNLKQYNEKLKAAIDSSHNQNAVHQLSQSQQYAVNQNMIYLNQIQNLKTKLEESQQQYAHVVNQILALQQKGLLRVTANMGTTQVISHPQPQPSASVSTNSTPNSVIPPVQQLVQYQPANALSNQHLAIATQQPPPPQPEPCPISISPPHVQVIVPPSQPATLPSSPPQVEVPAISPSIPLPETLAQHCASTFQSLSLSSPQAPAPPPTAAALESGGGPSASAEVSTTYSSLAQALSPGLGADAEVTNTAISDQTRDMGEPRAQAPPTPPRSFKSMSPEESILGRGTLKRSPSPGGGTWHEGWDGLGDGRRKRARVSEEAVAGPSKREEEEGGVTEGVDASMSMTEEEVREPVGPPVKEQNPEVSSAEEEQISADEMQVDVQEEGEHIGEEEEEEEEELRLERDPETGLYREEEVIVHLFEEDDDNDDILHCPFCSLQTFVEVWKVWLIMVCHKKWTRRGVGRYMTGRRNVVLYPLAFLAFVIMVLAVFMVVNVALTFSQPSRQDTRRVLQAMNIDFIVWTSLSLLLDTVVACILVVTLWKSRAGTYAADGVVRQVISITFQSAVLPAITMITAVVLHNYTDKGNLVILFLLLTGKLYAFGLLRTLNSRDKLRKRMRNGSRDLGRVSLDLSPNPNAQFDTWAWHTSTPTVHQLPSALKAVNPLATASDSTVHVGASEDIDIDNKPLSEECQGVEFPVDDDHEELSSILFS